MVFITRPEFALKIEQGRDGFCTHCRMIREPFQDPASTGIHCDLCNTPTLISLVEAERIGYLNILDTQKEVENMSAYGGIK